MKLKTQYELLEMTEPKVYRILVLEDDGERGMFFMDTLPGHRLSITNNAPVAVGMLSEELFDVIFLDHDLGGQTYVASSEENCGMEVVRHLEECPGVNKDTLVIIHSWNVAAAQVMAQRLKDSEVFKGQVVQALFSSDEFMNAFSQVFRGHESGT
jgi:CheY-like chemotaxis protein